MCPNLSAPALAAGRALTTGVMMFELRMAESDFTQMRFVYSPLSEVIGSLYMLHSTVIPPVHRVWAESIRPLLAQVDQDLLRAVIPAGQAILGVPVGDATPSTSIEGQLELFAALSPKLLRAELEKLWEGQPLPAAAKRVSGRDPAGPRQVAEALWNYWDIVLRPWWPRIRAVLDAEVGYRAQQLARGGIVSLMADLHPQLQLHGHMIRMAGGPCKLEFDLTGSGLLLIPCVFIWPRVVFDPSPPSSPNSPCLTYGPRGTGTLWETSPARPPDGDDPLAALIGHSRAVILRATGQPVSTTELAHDLRLSAPTVSVHLATLKRSGMVTSWRSGQRMLYQRTPLASSVILAAADGTALGRNGSARS